MNAKLAKILREAAGYRNQTATPGTIPFPGVARFYAHPVVSRRPAIRTSYVRLPLEQKPTKVRTKVQSLVLDGRNQPVVEMHMVPVQDPILDAHGQQVYDDKGQPKLTTRIGKDGQPVLRAEVKTQPVPVTNPARLDPSCPKGVYRSLKRLARRGRGADRLVELGIALDNARKEAQ